MVEASLKQKSFYQACQPFFPHFFPRTCWDLSKFSCDLLLFQEEVVTVRANNDVLCVTEHQSMSTGLPSKNTGTEGGFYLLTVSLYSG